MPPRKAKTAFTAHAGVCSLLCSPPVILSGAGQASENDYLSVVVLQATPGILNMSCVTFMFQWWFGFYPCIMCGTLVQGAWSLHKMGVVGIEANESQTS